jgi:hypothetical protein
VSYSAEEYSPASILKRIVTEDGESVACHDVLSRTLEILSLAVRCEALLGITEVVNTEPILHRWNHTPSGFHNAVAKVE